MLQQILYLISLLFVFVILSICTYTDLKTKTVPVYLIFLLYVFVFINMFSSGKDHSEASICFCFTLVLFMLIHVVTKKKFGMGDVLIISAIAWLIGSSEALKIFLINMSLFSIPYSILCYLYYRKRFSLDPTNNKDTYPYIPVVFLTTIILFIFPDIFIY